MESLLQDTRFAIRSLRRKPGFLVVAVLSLGLGIGANTAIFSLINEIFLSPLPIEDAHRMVAVFTADERAGGQNALSHLNWRDVREQNEVFEEFVGYDFSTVAVSTTGGEPTIQFALMVSGNYFDALGVQAHRGRFFLPDEDQTPGSHPVVVLHERFWREELGGDDGVIGSNIRLNGHGFTVVGVSPPEFDGLHIGIQPTMYIPMMMNKVIRNDPQVNWYDERRGLFLFAMGKLKDGRTLEDANANLGILAARLEADYPDDNEGRGMEAVPLAEVTVFNRGGVRSGMTLLMAVVGVVLLIACANVANLMLARATERRKEIALRLAVGINRGRLIRQLLTESVLVALAGGAVGLLVAVLGRGWITGLLGAVPGGVNIAVDMSLDPLVLVFTLLLALLTGLLFGLLPAIQSSRPELVGALKDQEVTVASGGRFQVRNLLVIAQIALSLVALVFSGLFLRSLEAAQEIDLGYDTDDLISVQFDVGLQGYSPEQGEQFFRTAAERIGSLPGVRSVALSQAGPLQGTFLRSVLLEGENPEERTYVEVNAAGPEYFEVMGIGIEEGRSFTPADRAGSVAVVIVNSVMAERYWPGQSAIGKRFSFFNMDPVEVVGVAETIKYQNPGEDPRAYAYLPLDQYNVTNINVLARVEGDPDAAALTAAQELRRLEPDLVVNSASASTVVSNALAGQRSTAAFLALFGGIALALASIGIYGVMAYSVRSRSRELGIRIALGASRPGVLAMVLRQGMVMALIGLAVGVVAALALSRLLAQMLFVSPQDPLAFLGTFVALLAASFLACLAPSLRAMRLDAIRVLRAE